MNFKALKSTRTLVVCGMLAAIGIALKFFSFDFTTLTRLTLAFVPVYFAAILYGGGPAALVGIVVDVAGALIKGGGYFPHYTVTFIVAGLLFGLLYRLSTRITKQWVSIVLCTFIMQVLCSVLLNGVAWQWMLFGYPQMVANLPFTLLKQLFYIPAYSVILIPLTKAFQKYPAAYQ